MALAVGAHRPPRPATSAAVDPAIAKLLAGIRAADKGQLAVSEEDGRFLRVLVGATNARQVLEIGAASGYSAIWIGMGLRQTGGRLTTIEFDPVRAKEAAANVQRAGLSDIVRVVARRRVQGNPEGARAASISCSSMRGSRTTRSSSTWCFRASTPGGLFLAHNVINKKNDMLDFLSAIEKHPMALNTTVSPGHEGISITYKKR